MVFERSPGKPAAGSDRPSSSKKPATPSTPTVPALAPLPDPPAATSSAADDIDWITGGTEPIRASDFAAQPWRSPPGHKTTQPGNIEFGKPSPLQRPGTGAYAHLFNMPKPGRARPEFGRDTAQRPVFRNPLDPRPRPTQQQTGSPDVVEIPKPVQGAGWASGLGSGPALFYSSTGQQAERRVDVDLTDPALAFDRFGAPGVYDYVDTAKATQDIKALLEGAFEDEEEKPKTRGRRRKEAKTEDLSAKLAATTINSAAEKEESEPEEEEEDDVDDGTVEGLKVKLLPHQVEGVEWMRDKETGSRKIKGSRPKGGILADDMGLGKTIQSISLMLTNPRPPRHQFSGGKEDKDKLSNAISKGTLVVAPLALIKQWEAEIDTKVADTHRLQVLVHHGPSRTKRAQDLKKYDVVITTYQILVSEYGNCTDKPDGKYGCFGVHWYRVILDEAHSIKNRNAKATQACYKLDSEYRWCLTGTPMQNNLEEIQSLIKFLRIRPYDELAVWRQQIQQPMNAGRGGVAMRRLQYYLKAFMKRRTKDILKIEGALNPGGKADSETTKSNGFKITERRVEKLEIEFTPQERQFYERLEARADKSIEQMVSDANMSYASALTLLLRLRQACNHAELVTKSKSKDKDAFAIDQLANQSPSNQSTSERDIDDLADALGALGVEATRCDVCQIKLSESEKGARMIRCTDCQAEVDTQQTDASSRREMKKANKKKKHHEQREKRKQRNRRVIDDSDEDEGEWIVSDEERSKLKLGRAGGSDDENAEGGGEWIASDDSETGEEDSLQILGSHKKKAGKSATSDEEGTSSFIESDESEDSDESESDQSSLDSAPLKSAVSSGPITSTKITKLLEILRRESGEHKFIVFSVFTSMLDLIEPTLKEEGMVFTRYDGSMRNDLREASLNRLRNDKRTRVMLCSLKCGSLGLNLTAASRVVILEPFWNPFVEEQAIDRVHRLNQTVDVTVYKLTIAGTVEERIFALQEKKRALAEAAIEGKSIAKLSMQDILNLFKHDHGHHDPADKHAELAVKPGVLHATAHGGSSSQAQAQQRHSGSRHGTPPEAHKPRGAENSIYGRRW